MLLQKVSLGQVIACSDYASTYISVYTTGLRRAHELAVQYIVPHPRYLEQYARRKFAAILRQHSRLPSLASGAVEHQILGASRPLRAPKFATTNPLKSFISASLLDYDTTKRSELSSCDIRNASKLQFTRQFL